MTNCRAILWTIKARDWGQATSWFLASRKYDKSNKIFESSMNKYWKNIFSYRAFCLKWNHDEEGLLRRASLSLNASQCYIQYKCSERYALKTTCIPRNYCCTAMVHPIHCRVSVVESTPQLHPCCHKAKQIRRYLLTASCAASRCERC